MELITSDKKPTSDSNSREAMYIGLERVLMELKQIDQFKPFLNRVSAREAPDYYEVISKPMDLTTMRKKLKTNLYNCKSDFAEDIDRIYSNCMAYNLRPDHEYRKFAALLRDKALVLLNQVPDTKLSDITFASQPALKLDPYFVVPRIKIAKQKRKKNQEPKTVHNLRLVAMETLSMWRNLKCFPEINLPTPQKIRPLVVLLLGYVGFDKCNECALDILVDLFAQKFTCIAKLIFESKLPFEPISLFRYLCKFLSFPKKLDQIKLDIARNHKEPVENLQTTSDILLSNPFPPVTRETKVIGLFSGFLEEKWAKCDELHLAEDFSSRPKRIRCDEHVYKKKLKK